MRSFSSNVSSTSTRKTTGNRPLTPFFLRRYLLGDLTSPIREGPGLDPQLFEQPVLDVLRGLVQHGVQWCGHSQAFELKAPRQRHCTDQ